MLRSQHARLPGPLMTQGRAAELRSTLGSWSIRRGTAASPAPRRRRIPARHVGSGELLAGSDVALRAKKATCGSAAS
eukprot:scaffold8493_cov67-Phaeocystis_antarctica.AAC.1